MAHYEVEKTRIDGSWKPITSSLGEAHEYNFLSSALELADELNKVNIGLTRYRVVLVTEGGRFLVSRLDEDYPGLWACPACGNATPEPEADEAGLCQPCQAEWDELSDEAKKAFYIHERAS